MNDSVFSEFNNQWNEHFAEQLNTKAYCRIRAHELVRKGKLYNLVSKTIHQIANKSKLPTNIDAKLKKFSCNILKNVFLQLHNE